MNGILVINKEKNVTSHDVVNQIRKIFKIKKVGHVGTLDPISTGVLVILIGNTTKLAPFLENDSKEYIARICFGLSTDTYDVTGNTIEESNDFILSEEQIDKCLKQMIGVQKQTPPIYSAIKVSGKKLYEYARKQQEVEIPTRTIEVFDAKRISPLKEVDNRICCDVIFNVSKGTYIRSLIHDLGKIIDIPCCMKELNRTRSGKFFIEKSVKIDDVKVGNYQLINPVEIIDLPSLNVDENSDVYKKAINGMKISPSIYEEKPERFAVICNNKLVAIYEFCNLEIPHYKSIRVWND